MHIFCHIRCCLCRFERANEEGIRFMSQQFPPQQPWQGGQGSQPLPPEYGTGQSSLLPPQGYTQYPQQQQSPLPYPQPGQYQPNQPPYYSTGPGMMPPQPPKKKSRRRTWIIVGVIVLILIIIGAAANGTKGANTPTTTTNSSAPAATQPATQPAAQPTTATTPTATPTTAPTPTPTPSFANFGDGTYQVGKDIQPGTYRTREGSPGCYYARLKGFGGTVGEIIANNNTDNPAIVTIKATDKGFESQSCGTWTKDLSQITTSKTSFDDGMYIVGTDIAPGTYKNTGSSGCYFARLSGFGNTVDDIISNNNVDTATIVTIASSDKGFESNNCGTWTKQ